MLSASTDAIAPGQPLSLTGTLESYAGPLSGSVAFMEGGAVLFQVALQDDAASIGITAHRIGIHYYTAVFQGPHGLVVATTPIAVTVGRLSDPLSISNQKHTVVGGRTAACDPATSAVSPYQPGCEVIFSDWLPGALVTYTISYADGTSSTFTGTADANGHLQHAFAVAYQPPAGTTHGRPETRAWISVVATSADGAQVKSACLRFAVLG